GGSGRLETVGDGLPGKDSAGLTFFAGQKAVELLLGLGDGGSVDEHCKGDARRPRRGDGNDPAGLAGAQQSDMPRVDAWHRPERIHGTNRVGRQQVEVAAVTRAADAPRFADAPLVIGEDGNAGPDETGAYVVFSVANPPHRPISM